MSSSGPADAAAAVSLWHVVDQATIDRFADATGDHQFIHVDPERARQAGFGTTIAHGFLGLSLVPALFWEAVPGDEEGVVIVNYGLDRVRFTAPVPSGSRVRARFEQVGRERRSPTDTLIKYAVTLEIEGGDKPAMVAEWLIVRRAA
ncbi:MaoC family dehydratase [Rhodoplanes sp. TEM]|uniref:MaoC family dehydratase n=1 Tax=Rhodoplanes tepidamans TaxID=200616 RepID=A0ABT5J7W6_RHOTP|nr:MULTISPECIES: MaoC family dehydratase [Rhodoplanes]MDC7785678.1 MaoC family dehydratase [Rhodoplanes tepidamans]MDC7983319.1 MaoC family dehydratase [Rhodoplanes sp. TEM]MDQ0354754.1 acyl dehydratase [Rhodoplanes tepidamans]